MKSEGLVINWPPPPKRWRLAEIDPIVVVKEFGLWQLLWGTDVFLGKIPLMKLLVLVIIIVWIVT